jgi:hypothetical protein
MRTEVIELFGNTCRQDSKLFAYGYLLVPFLSENKYNEVGFFNNRLYQRGD